MTASELPYPMFDADNHLYETQDAFTRHLPRGYENVIQYVQINGRTKIAIRGQISEYIPNPTFEVVARPGAMEEYFAIGNPEGKSRRQIFGEPMRDDPELIHVVVHSLNQWLDEVWSFNYKDRIFTTPVISLPIVEKAIAELDWAVERGARAILVRPAPVPGFRGSRSFALPEFDPFWKRVTEHNVLVAMHSSDSGYARYQQDWEGSRTEMLPFVANAFRMVGQWRPVTDAVASWVCHGALYRFPELKVAVIENGSAWLVPLLNEMADIYKKAPEAFPSDPVEMIRSRIHISPFWEDDLGELADIVGVDRVLFGSDYPHPEGLARPARYIDVLDERTKLTQEEKAKVMGGNLARLMAA
jgi:predicted TIM-barrel fold metal-dependent hydrolase